MMMMMMMNWGVVGTARRGAVASGGESPLLLVWHPVVLHFRLPRACMIAPMVPQYHRRSSMVPQYHLARSRLVPQYHLARSRGVLRRRRRQMHFYAGYKRRWVTRSGESGTIKTVRRPQESGDRGGSREWSIRMEPSSFYPTHIEEKSSSLIGVRERVF